MDFYLTDKIYIHDNQMFKDGKRITKNNWHKILSDYGWEKICVPWIKKLNKLSKNKPKNSCYGVYDCPSDGNCFFHCIANALNERDRFEGERYNYKDIREIIACSITEEDFKTLMSYYRIMKDADDFDEEWDPYQIETIDDFRSKIRQTGHCYWGDYLLLSLITKQLGLNIMILNCDDNVKDYNIYNTMIEYNKDYSSIFLLYEDNCHFKLIGNFNDLTMISYYKHENIPIELIKLFKIKY